MKYKLRMTRDEVVENAVSSVRHLRALGCEDIEFSPEDAGRSVRAARRADRSCNMGLSSCRAAGRAPC